MTPASNRLQLIDWKKGCCFTRRAPQRSDLPPSRSVALFASNCSQNDFESSPNLDEYLYASQILLQNHKSVK